VSEHAPAREQTSALRDGWESEDLAPSILQRRAAASAARRRRLLYIDIGLGVTLALLALLISGGLALIALALAIGTISWGGIALISRLRRRRARRHVAGRRRRSPQADPASARGRE